LTAVPFTVISVQECTQTGRGYEAKPYTLVIYRTQEGDFDQLILPKHGATKEEIEGAIKGRLGAG